MTSYRTTQPQHVTGLGGNQVVTFAGKCVVCGNNLYRIDDDDPDPRGHVNEYHACKTLVAADYQLQGPDVLICWYCGNVRERYESALHYAYNLWR